MTPEAGSQKDRIEIEEITHSLCGRIKAAREAMALTPARLALKAGITRPDFNKVEEGDPSTPFSYYLMVVWRIDNFASCHGLISPEGLKERGRSPVNQLMRLCGERIREMRIARGMSVKDLALGSSLPASKVMQMEWGNLWSSFEDYARVFKTLGETNTLKAILL